MSNFGGPHPKEGDKTEKSVGTAVAVDERSVSVRGAATVIDVQLKKKIAEVATRIQPESMVLSPDGKLLDVTDDGGDGISVLDTKTFNVIHTINTKPDPSLPYGSLTTALAFSTDGKTLLAANAGNNAIELIDPKRPQQGLYGFVAAGGFPGTICIAGNNKFIGNVTALKGEVQKVVLLGNQAEVDKYTSEAKKGFCFAELLRAQTKANANASPKPVPDNPGEPSSIKHVVYIIKENK